MTPHVVLTYPHSLGVVGGGTVHCRNLALELREAGADVTLLTVETSTLSMFPRPAPPAGEDSRKFTRPLASAGVELRTLPQSSLGWWFDGRQVRRALTQLLDTSRIDAVFGWWGELSYATELLAERGVFSGILAAAPYSQWWRRTSGHPRWLHRMMDDRVVARTARSVDRVFANSRCTAGELTSLLGVDPARVEIVAPSVHALCDGARRPRRESIEKLFFFGRVRREKGVFDLVEALSHLENETWQLRIAGSGDTRAVADRARQLGISDRVAVLGHLDAEAMAVELERAQLAVLPSYWESFGLAVAEAQLAGLPVIAYDAGAVLEICSDGETGWVVPLRDIGRLTEALREALTRPEETLRRGRTARERSRHLVTHRAGEKILKSVKDWRRRTR